MLSDGGSLGGFLTFFSFRAKFERGGRGGLLVGLTARVVGALRWRFAGASLPMRMDFMCSRYPAQTHTEHLTNPAVSDRIDGQ